MPTQTAITSVIASIGITIRRGIPADVVEQSGVNLDEQGCTVLMPFHEPSESGGLNITGYHLKNLSGGASHKYLIQGHSTALFIPNEKLWDITTLNSVYRLEVYQGK